MTQHQTCEHEFSNGGPYPAGEWVERCRLCGEWFRRYIDIGGAKHAPLNLKKYFERQDREIVVTVSGPRRRRRIPTFGLDARSSGRPRPWP